MAMASVSCDSAEIEPKLMAPVQNRLTISFGRFDLINRNGSAGRAGLNLQQSSRKCTACRERLRWHVRENVDTLRRCRCVRQPAGRKYRLRVPHMSFAVSARQWNSPTFGNVLSVCVLSTRGNRSSVAARVLWQRHQIDTPWIRLAVPAKQRSMTSSSQPDGLKDLGPLVRLKSGDAHLGHHLQHALGNALTIRSDTTLSSSNSPPARSPSRCECQSDSKARYGLIASAP